MMASNQLNKNMEDIEKLKVSTKNMESSDGFSLSSTPSSKAKATSTYTIQQVLYHIKQNNMSYKVFSF